jgi:predicted PurR-regulated permease PerM
VLLFISFILMTAINPLIRLTQRWRIPTIVIVLAVYVGIITLFSTLVASLIPAVVSQTRGLTQALPTYLHNLEDTFNTRFDPAFASDYLSNVPSNILKLAAGVFSNALNVMVVFFMTYYLIIERPNLHRYLLRLFDDKNAEARAESLVHSIEKQVGGWVRGQLILMVIIGVMTYIGLVALGIPYALPLATLAGLLEAVPNLGPIIAAIPAVLMGFAVSPIIGMGALALSILIQQLENNLIVPKVMLSATGTAPLATIVVLLVGYTLGGVMGAVLAMPLYLSVLTVINELSTKH